MDVLTRGHLHAWLQSATDSDIWNHFKIRELPPSNGGQNRFQNLESIQDLGPIPSSARGRGSQILNRFKILESRPPSVRGRASEILNRFKILESIPHPGIHCRRPLRRRAHGPTGLGRSPGTRSPRPHGHAARGPAAPCASPVALDQVTFLFIFLSFLKSAQTHLPPPSAKTDEGGSHLVTTHERRLTRLCFRGNPLQTNANTRNIPAVQRFKVLIKE